MKAPHPPPPRLNSTEQGVEEIVVVRGVPSTTEYVIDHAWRREGVDNLDLYKLARLGKMDSLVARCVDVYGRKKEIMCLLNRVFQNPPLIVVKET